MRIWSLYQKAIFEFVQNGNGNAVVEAVPGSGKSTTLIEILNYVPKSSHPQTLFLAFSKKIVEDLKNNVPEGIQCNTFHSFCLKVLKKLNPKLKVDIKGEKLRKIITSLVGDAEENEELRSTLDQTIRLAKAYLAHNATAVSAVMTEHEIDSPRIDFSDLVVQALDICAVQYNIVDFDDMIWFISRFDIELPAYAFVLIDEGQDCNPGRIDIVKRLAGDTSATNPSTRVIAVGDSDQAIFQFCGSCSNSMEQLRCILNAKSFPLTISYRCAKLIVSEAQKYVSNIEAAPNAHPGVVETVPHERMLNEAGPGDFIISRINAPLVKLCLSFLVKGKKANIQGRDMGRSLDFMIKLSKARDVKGFLEFLSKWSSEQQERIAKRNGDSTHITDRVSCLEMLCVDTNDLKVVRRRIKNLFAEVDDEKYGDDKITLATAHRAKGRECQRAWLLMKTFKDTSSVEDKNIIYVAITRAKSHLFFVSSET